ncbi:MAG: hypothetical protein JWP63_3072 [Candidatus Solibacter sp.]|nr:hypothetical protein [Candidatus Solibacter sp.]
MKTQRSAELVVAALAMLVPGFSATAPKVKGAPTEMVITVQPAHQGGNAPQRLEAADVKLMQGKTSVHVTGLDRLSGDLADMQLFVLLDDSTRSSGLGIHLPELKTFLQSLPATTQVAVGYMHNGTFALQQGFTADHAKASDSLRLPAAIPGENGSPYFVVSDLAKHWPSEQATPRRAVLMLTDGVDRYYDTQVMDDPYVDAAVKDALQNGVMVYSIYLRGAGFYGRGGWATTLAQSRLNELSQETGGYSYWENFSDPVTITPFLNDFQKRLGNQYRLSFQAVTGHGSRPVKLGTEVPGIKIEGPSRVYVQ